MWDVVEPSLTSLRLISRLIRLTKHVICRRKSMRTAKAEYIANVLTAGMSVRAPVTEM